MTIFKNKLNSKTAATGQLREAAYILAFPVFMLIWALNSYL